MSKKILLVLVLLAFAGSSFAQIVDEYNHYLVGVDDTEDFNSLQLPATLSTTKNCYGTLNVTGMPSGNHWMSGSTNQVAMMREHGGIFCDLSRSTTGITHGLPQEIPFGSYPAWCIRVGGSNIECEGAYILHVQKGTTGGGAN